MVLPRGSFFSVVSNLMDENAELRHEIADLQGQADVYKGAKEVIDELRQRVQTLQTALANLYRAIMYAGSLDDVHNDGMGTTMADAQAALKEQADE
jgi:beta-phosphoglucomutase-like phosphatase (HAD superfamily)